MKYYYLESLAVTNFMNYAEKEITFSRATKITGENASGKSTWITAYMWLFFNCDNDLRDNPPVRREVDGKSIDDIDVSVTATVEIDDVPVVFRKVQKRKYSKDKTSYKDDNTYYINEVSKTLTEFNAYLGIDVKTIRTCCNISAFLNNKPDEMRRYLFTLAADVTDLDIAKQKPELSGLIPLLEKYKRDEIIALNKKVVSDVKAELPVIKGQISEKERDIQLKKETDISEQLKEKEQIETRLSEINKALADNDTASKEYQALSDGILELKFKQNELVRKANEELSDKRNENRRALKDTLFEITEINKDINAANDKIKSLKADIERKETERTRKVDEWRTAKDTKFDDTSLVCPYCKQEYPEDKKEQLKAEFDTHKRDMLKEIERAGIVLKTNIEQERAEITKLEEEIATRNITLSTLNEEGKNLSDIFESLPERADVTGTDEYKLLQADIEKKETMILAYNSMSEVRESLKSEEKSLTSRLTDITVELEKLNAQGDEERLDYLNKLYSDKEQIETDAQKIIDLVKELDKCKNEALSDEINSNFRLVKWKLWEFTKGGEYKSVCVPMVEGKSILTTMSNKANRIMGKIDICKSLQNVNGISCPIWIDDAESLDSNNQHTITSGIPGQLILLAVNDNKVLEVKDLDIESEE